MTRARTRPLAALAALAALMAPAAALAAEAVEVESARLGFGDRNQYKLGAWNPLRLQVKGGTERFAGFLEVVVPDDEGIETVVRQRVDVAPGESRRYVAYVRPGGRESEFTVRFVDESGRRGTRPAPTPSGTPFEPLMPGEDLLLTLGNPQGVELVPGLPGYNTGSVGPGGGAGSLFLVSRVDAGGLDDQLPGRWIGYDGVRVVVLDINDAAAMDALRAPGKAEALKRWVEQGGHLVVAGAAGWQRLVDSALADALPAVPAGQVSLAPQDLRALESFASTNEPVPDAGRVQVAKLEQVEARRGKVLSAVADVPLVVRGPYGFGRITLVGVDADQKPLATWEDRAQFWAKAMDLPRPTGAAGGTPAAPLGGGQIFVSGVTDLSTALRRGLEQFEGIKLIPFGWVAFFIFLYILLIGPGDYFFLKKVVKRMELTWITFPTIVIAVSLAAYYVAYEVKGTELRVNKVDVVDVDQVTGQLRGRTWANVFSPQNRDYDVSVTPLAPDSDPPEPVRGAEVVTSWYGVAEPGFGGMGGGGRMGLSPGGYAYEPVGGAESLRRVRIPIWSTKCVTARWTGPGAKVVEADLEPVGSDRLNGTVTNTLGKTLTGAMLAFNTQVYDLGTLAPGANVRVELQPSRNLIGYLRALRVNAPNAAGAYGDGARIDLNELVRTLMFQEVLAAEQPVGNRLLGELDLTGQLELDRPMLFARVEGEAATLELGNAPAAPRVAQTTLIRAILPLKPAPAN